YLIEQDAHKVLIESEDMNYDSEQIDQNDEDTNLAEERDLLASLIKKLKCEIDETKNRNTLLETSNKVLVEKLKKLKRRDSIEYATKMELECAKVKAEFYTYKKESQMSCVKHTVNAHLYADYKKSKAELQRRNNIEYATEMELECAKVRGDLLSYKMEYERDINTIVTGVELRKQKIANPTYYGHIEPVIKNTIEQNFDPVISKINVGLNIFLKRLNEEMVADLRYFNYLESEVDSLTSQLETQKT
nr:hypothetical protein [Tanacetum cinerariifolium]